LTPKSRLSFMKPAQKVLVLGATGMLGHMLFSVLSENNAYATYATVRNTDALYLHLRPKLHARILPGIDANEFTAIHRTLTSLRPNVVVNCIGIIKQQKQANDPIISIKANSLLPHLLSNACSAIGARLIHISTDCVFSGMKGLYTEQDPSDAIDLYGRTKILGEVNAPHCTILRSSIIGHELSTSHGLLEWFLRSKSAVRGYSKVKFSGFPTIEFSKIIADYVIPNTELSGLYHVSSEPISKYELLKLIAVRYDKPVTIQPYDGIICDRSLNSEKFKAATGYCAPSWEHLITRMHRDACSRSYQFGG
jgi:dTDP-4-dehydrorhamnose reductase